MRKSVISFLVVFFVIFHLSSCNKQNNNDGISINKTEIAEVTHTINSCIAWFEHKDFELLYSVVSKDSNYLSIHPNDKIIRGYSDFKKNSEIFRNPDFTYIRHEIKDLIINFSSTGDVAWFYCMLDDINSWKGQLASWENTRWTGVLEKRNGKWVIVQQHFSFAAH